MATQTKTDSKSTKPRTPRRASLAGIKTAVKEARESTSVPVSAAGEAVASGIEVKNERKLDKFGRVHTVGKRKNAIARVWLKPGSGRIVVNGRDMKVYFARPVLQMIVNQPFEVANRSNQYDVECLVNGGGLSGQAGALKHGISKALALFEPDLRAPLKKAKFLRRDARVVERKKYGRVKARKRFQYSKR